MQRFHPGPPKLTTDWNCGVAQLINFAPICGMCGAAPPTLTRWAGTERGLDSGLPIGIPD